MTARETLIQLATEKLESGKICLVNAIVGIDKGPCALPPEQWHKWISEAHAALELAKSLPETEAQCVEG